MCAVVADGYAGEDGEDEGEDERKKNRKKMNSNIFFFPRFNFSHKYRQSKDTEPLSLPASVFLES